MKKLPRFQFVAVTFFLSKNRNYSLFKIWVHINSIEIKNTTFFCTKLCGTDLRTPNGIFTRYINIYNAPDVCMLHFTCIFIRNIYLNVK